MYLLHHHLLLLLLLLVLYCLFPNFVTSTDAEELISNLNRNSKVDKWDVRQSLSNQLKWTDINVSTRDRRKKLIQIQQGTLESGRLLGILGPSGSGKSTFLRTLASRGNDNVIVQGTVVVEEKNAFHSLRKDEVAFVHQDHNFFGMLTVFETLKLSLDLQKYSVLGTGSNSVDADNLLREVINVMGLKSICNSLVGGGVGGPGHSISGGEHKILSVACELLGNPVLLIADEPTSGLDSFQALQVMQTLHDLTKSKNIVTICSVHQPRSTIWSLFDDIMLFSPGGRIVYHGPRNDIVSYFAALGFSCPANTNPAEFLIDLVSIDPTTAETLEKSVARIAGLVNSFDSYSKARSNQVSTDGLQMEQVGESGYRERESASGRGLARIGRRIKNSTIRIWLLFKRSFLQTIRDGKLNFGRVGVSALLALVISSVYGYQGSRIDPDSVSNRVNIIAQAAINVAMLSMIKALQLFKKERPVIDRERSENLYSSLEYLLAKSSAELPLDALVGGIFGWILHQRTGIVTPLRNFVGMLSLLGAVCSSLGLAVGALAPSGDAALSIGPALMVVYVIMGAIGPAGIKSETLPALLKPFRIFSPIKWACESLCSAEFRHQNFDISKSQLSMGPLSLLKLVSRKLLLLPWHFVQRLFGAKSQNQLVDAVMTDGDRALKMLGIMDTTFSSGLLTMWRMLGCHLGLALVGLLLTRTNS